MNDQLFPQIKFISEQISQQHRDLKTDIRSELALLRQDLADEFKHTESRIASLKDETDRRLTLMEEQILSLQKFKWASVGITSLIVIVAEILFSRVH